MRLAIMSFAHLHAEGYIHNLRAIPDVEAIGFADEDADRGRHFSTVYDTHWFESYEQLLAEQPDGVIICSENANHRYLAEMAASAGAHILSEKPLATTLEDAQHMIDACERAGVQLMTAFPMRFSAPVIEIKTVESSYILRQNVTNQANYRACTRPSRDWFVIKTRRRRCCRRSHGSVVDRCVGFRCSRSYAALNNIFNTTKIRCRNGRPCELTFARQFATTIVAGQPPNYTSGLTMELVGEQGWQRSTRSSK
jgi:hypothetical protein